ncbi:hypothetical protein GCM10022393_35470 [Aquimarina addita]|uniref:Uncharacterized protein n=2 Tax=Aquimarina addita TaxID=870485 RepID=A0ABP6URA9_9FLAO
MLTVVSCDDGDIIVTSFEFDDSTLELCRGSLLNEFVFFKINTTTNEAISYNFTSPIYNDTTVTDTPILIDLENDDNQLVYRQFNNTVTSDYYCNTIPDSDITVTEELISISGEASIIVEIVDEDDNDGVLAINEDVTVNVEDEDINGDGDLENDDTDNDGIPNYKDQDDDNDNVLTSVEIPNNDVTDESFLDTDEDGTPNYLDEDDDGDGIKTINEDLDNDGSPRDDDSDNDGIPNYLDNDDDNDGILTIDEDINQINDARDDDTDDDGIPDYLDTNSDNDEAPSFTGEVSSSLDNTVITTFRTTLTVNNILFGGSNDQFTDEDFSFGFRDQEISITTPK